MVTAMPRHALPRSKRRRHAIGALLAGLLVAAVVDTLPAHPATALDIPQLRGVQLHSLWSANTSADVDRQLELVAGTGATVARLDVAWSSLQFGGRGTIDASYQKRLDYAVAGATARNIKLILTVAETPCWASTAPDSLKLNCTGAYWDRMVTKYAPSDPADYAWITSWIATRYGSRIAALELWNEPNYDSGTYFTFQAPDKPLAYTQLVKTAYPAIKAVAPTLPVLAGALSFSDDVFLKALYANGILGFYDGLSTHPYNEWRAPGAPHDPQYYKWDLVQGMAAIRTARTGAGDSTPLWLTEFGYTTCTLGTSRWCVTPEQQATYLADATRLVASWSDVRAFIIYNLRNKGTDASDSEHNFGLVTTSYVQKPSYAAVSDVFRTLAAAPVPTEPPSPTASPSPSASPSASPSPSESPSASTPEPSPTPTGVAESASPTPSATETAATESPTPSPSAVQTPAESPSPSASPSPSDSPLPAPPPPDLTPPGAVTGLSVSGGSGTAALSWTNPGDADLGAVTVVMQVGRAAPVDPTSGVVVANGTATVTSVTGLTPGRAYAFAAFAVDRNGNVAAPATAVLAGTTIASTSSAVVVSPALSTVKGRLLDDTGAAVAGQSVVVLTRPVGTTTWTTAGRVTSAADGAVSWSGKSVSTDWQLRYDGGAGLTASLGPVTSAPVATSVSIAASATRLSLGSFLTLTGAVGPVHAGQTVYVDVLNTAGWTTVTSGSLSSTSTYKLRFKVATKGAVTYRVRKPADTDHAVGTSSSVVVTVV
jgi:hypothetical protein